MDWDELTLPDKLDHIETCTLCDMCEPHRAFGVCRSCGDTKEALPPEGLSRCCGTRVNLTPGEVFSWV